MCKCKIKKISLFLFFCLAALAVILPQSLRVSAISVGSYGLTTLEMDNLYSSPGKNIKVNGVTCRYYAGKTMAEVYGIGRSDVVNYLEKNKMLYVTTTGSGTCATTPKPGPGGALNCAGFVCHLLSGVVQNTNNPSAPWFWGSVYGCGTSWQLDHVCADEVKCYVFSSDSDGSCNEKLLKSGLAEKGDILLYLMSSADTHSAVYWGKETINGITYKNTIFQANVWVTENHLGTNLCTISKFPTTSSHCGVVLVKVGNEVLKPTKVKAVSAASGTEKVTVSWKGSANNESYKIYRSDNGGKYKLIGTAEKCKYFDTSVAVGNSYSYKIRAVGNDGTYKTSKATDAVSVKLPAPSKVTAVRSAAETKSVNITWKASSNAVKFRVLRSENGTTFKTIATVKTKKYTDTSVTLGKTYYYKVKALGADGKWVTSASSDRVEVTLLPPTSVKAVSTAKKKITVSWNAVPYANRYYVYRKDTSGNITRIAAVKTTSYTDSGLSYRFRMERAICTEF